MMGMRVVEGEYVSEIVEGLREMEDEVVEMFVMVKEEVLGEGMWKERMDGEGNGNGEIGEWGLGNVGGWLGGREGVGWRRGVVDSGGERRDEVGGMVVERVDEGR